MSGAADITTLGLAVDHHSVKQARDELGRFVAAGDKAASSGTRMEQSWSKVKGVLAGLALGAVTVQLIKQADALTLMDARLKLVTGSAENFAKAQGLIYNIAQKSNAGLAETTTLFTKLHEPVKRLGGDVNTTGKIVEAFAASLRVGGASTAEAASATLQFAQAMGSGKLSGDEFRAIAEASPRFMKAIADGANLPIDKLKELGSEGKLTADVVGNALLKSLASLQKEMAGLPDTVGGAMTRMTNDFKVALNNINKASGTTLGLAGMVEEARKLIPTLEREAVSAFQSIGAWIDENRQGLTEVWNQTKLFAGEVWEVVKAGASIVGFITQAVVQSGALRAVWETARLLVAGFQDGLTIIGAVLAGIGSALMDFLVTPLVTAGKLSAAVASVFDEDLAKSVRAHVQAIEDFAQGGMKYADGVVQRFANGDTAVARVAASMGQATEAATVMSAKVEEASVKTVTLKNANAELSKEQKATLKAYSDLTQGIREQMTELDMEIAGGQKLNEAQVASIRFKEELTDKYKGFTAVQIETVTKLLEEWDAKIRVAEATKKVAEATLEAAKAWEQQYTALEESNASLREQVVQQAYANASIRSGIDFSAKLVNARLREKAVAAELKAIKVEDKNLDFVRGQQYREEAELLRTLAQLNEENAAAMLLKKVDDYLDPNKAQTFGDALTKAFDGAGNALVKLTNTLSSYNAKQAELSKLQKELADNDTLTDEEKLKRQNALLKKQGELGVDTFASIAGSAKMFFSEGSKGYKTLEAAETAFRAYQLASDLVKGASAAAVGIANQAQGDPYTALPRMAAMAAVMAGLGFAVAGGFNKSAGAIDVKKRQEQTGTGTVLGDLTAKSESIANSIENMEDAASLANQYQAGMLAALKSIEAAMVGVSQQILRAGSLTTGKNFGIQEGTIATNKGDPLFGWTLFDKVMRNLPIIGGVVEKLQSLWGKTKQSIADTGLNISGTTGSLGVQQYVDVQTTKSSWFGLVKKTSNSRETQAVSDSLAQQFSLIFSTIGDTLKASAAQLGMDADQAAAQIASFVINIADLSLKDMSGEQIQEAISAAVGAQADRMAQTILPGLEAFQNVGEGYYETLLRVAGATETAGTLLDQLGITAIEYTQVLHKQGDVAAQIVKQSISQYETVGGSLSSVGKLISTFTGDANEIAQVYEALRDVRGSLRDIGFTGEELTATLIKSAGGLDALSNSAKTYFEQFFTDQEQFDISMRNLGVSFAELGYAVPKSREEFRALVETVRQLGPGSEDLLGKLLSLSGRFADLVPSAKDLAEAAEEAAEEVQDLTDALNKSFQDLLKMLRSAVDDAFSSLKNSVQAEKDKLKDAYDAQVDVLDAAAKAARATYDATMARIDDDRKAARARYDSDMAIIDAQRKAIDTAQKAQQTAYQSAVKAVAAEKASATDAYRKAAAQLTASVKAAGDTVNRLKSINDMLRSTAESLNPSGSDADLRRQAQGEIRAMLAAVQASGAIPDQKALQRALTIVSKPSEELFGSFEDYLRDFHYTKNDIEKLADYTGSQLDSAQAQLDATVAMKDALDAANAENMARLDAIREALDLGNELAKEAFESQLASLDAMQEAAKARLDGSMSSLDGQAESAQKLLDATLEVLDKAKDALGDQLELDLKALDDLLGVAQAQYEQLMGINTGIRDIPTALATLASAMQAFADASGTTSPGPGSGTNPNPNPMNQWVTNGQVQTYTDPSGAVGIQATGNTDLNQLIISGASGQNYTGQQAQDFVNANIGTNAGTVAAAAGTVGISLNNVDAIAGYTTGTTTALASGSGAAKIGAYTVDEIRAFITDRLKADKPRDIYDAAKTYGYTLASLDAIMNWPAGTARDWATANSLPVFGAGGAHSGGLRMVGEYGPEVEATGAARVWRLDQLFSAVANANGGSNNTEEFTAMRRELASMREELRTTTEAIAVNTRKTSKTLENWDTDGSPEVRTLT